MIQYEGAVNILKCSDSKPVGANPGGRPLHAPDHVWQSNRYRCARTSKHDQEV